MKRFKIKHLDILSILLYVLSIFCTLWAASTLYFSGSSNYAASELNSKLEERLSILDNYVETAFESDYDQWMELEDFPKDMVIYRYLNGELQSWANSFVISNDDISNVILYQRLADPKNAPVSPLATIEDHYSYTNLGHQWFLVRSETRGNFKVIAGLEVQDDNDNRRKNHVNPLLNVHERFSLAPLSSSGGAPVIINDTPVFKLLSEDLNPPVSQDSVLRWMALLLFVLASIMTLYSHRTLRMWAVIQAVVAIAFVWIHTIGRSLSESSMIFSPVLYADGQVLYSLAAVIILNLAILTFTVCFYIVRVPFYRWLRSLGNQRMAMALFSVLAFVAILSILAYSYLSFRSIVMNSNIELELYHLSDLSFYTGIVYVSYLTMLTSIPLIFYLLRPTLKSLFGKWVEFFYVSNSAILSIIFSLGFVITAAVLGTKKEDARVEVWTDRMAMERDIMLELNLRIAENEIAEDSFIATLSVLPNASNVVTNRILNSYLTNDIKGYDVSSIIIPSDNADPILAAFVTERISNGVRIHKQSRFMCSVSGSGRTRYSGLFSYLVPDYGMNYVLVTLESKDNRAFSGYNELLGLSSTNSLSLQSRYSYAKYNDGKLISYKGNYPYPTLISDTMEKLISDVERKHYERNGYVHFVNHVSDNELILVSRAKEKNSSYMVAFVVLVTFFYCLTVLIAGRRKKTRVFKNAFYKKRITVVLMSSLLITLIGLAAVSMIFVFDRNEKNRKETMAEKISSIQSIMSTPFRRVPNYSEVNPQELSNVLEMASNMFKADITLYNPYGKAFLSTASDVFDKLYLSDRIDDGAYYEIVYGHNRYVINKETMGASSYTVLYAPVFNDEGNMMAILSSPFSDDNYDFQLEAIMHAVNIFSVFILLVLLAHFLVSSVVAMMFKPVIELGRKMDATSVEKPELLEYDRQDEFTALVKSYNLMVADLAESTRKLTQAERDNAWNSMARQVAHEIKNPLTPMKLQIQRLIRLKQRNAEGWEDKFDDVAIIVLQHIDILSDTANEFSTFAKLNTETHVLINLDELLRQEISMFDNKENIEFRYYGLEGAEIMGPKPQLTRTLVNLLTNSVQAIDIHRAELTEEGKEAGKGIIMVSLRNSVRDGWYDIVIEDNGPGVKAENQDKLFTPNFTTKSSGTGLGLAICRSIIEKCGAEISYSKSFVLSGACFTICYPKASNQ